jgi:hypothetical protein
VYPILNICSFIPGYEKFFRIRIYFVDVHITIQARYVTDFSTFYNLGKKQIFLLFVSWLFSIYMGMYISGYKTSYPNVGCIYLFPYC